MVNGWLEYRQPIITEACPLKQSQKSLRPKLVPILPGVCEVGNLRVEVILFLTVEMISYNFNFLQSVGILDFIICKGGIHPDAFENY